MSMTGRKLTGKIAGVEAGGDWLKIALIEGAGSSPQISKLILIPIDGGVDGLGDVFPDAWKSLKKVKDPVVACLPRQLVNIRMIELPSTDPAEIDDMIDLQVGKQTPYSKDEIVFDYRLVGGGREGYTTVMLAIAQRSAVRQVFYAFEEAGIEIDQVTVSTEAIAGWLASSAKGGGCTAVLDVDSSFSDFIVMKGKDIQFSRSIRLGSDHLARQESVARIVKDVQSAIEAFRTERAGDDIGAVQVSGNTTSVSELVKALKEAGLKCSVKDAVKALRKHPKGNAETTKNLQKVSISGLVGLACAPESLEFNLVPDSISVRRGLVAKAKGLTAFGMLVMSCLVCLSLYGSIRGFALRQRVSMMQSELAEIGARSAEVADMMDIVGQVRARKDPGRSSLGALLAVRQALRQSGDKVRMSNVDLNIAEGNFVISCMTDNARDRHGFVKAMEQSDYFENVRESGAASKRVNGERKYSFQVSGDFEEAE